MYNNSIGKTAGSKRQPNCFLECGFYMRPLFYLLWGTLFALVFMGNGLSAKTMVDQLGRHIVVPESPQRVVALAPNLTEIIYTIGQQHRLVGVSRFSDFPKGAKTIPKVGSYVHLDLEKIVSLQPDLCIAIKDGNPKETADRLAALHVPVYVVDPRNLEAVLETTLEIGRLLNAENKAADVVQQLRSRIQKVDQVIASIEYRPRVFFQIGIFPIVSVGTDTFIHELVDRAGGMNVSQGRVTYPRFSREQVLSLAPEVIVITSMERGAVFQKVKNEWAQWQSLPAARRNRIFIEEADLFNRPTPRLVDGLELLVKLIHPELFGGRQ
jgi:cobalamin transport system substrate-binding protein